ncbi:TatD family hydrolase [Buchnera aphidicola]|uniref:TatD family deoxyribonuclease n=1 Tax=Buchnera aphidicola (Sarucallis kahawaluokalani) TaxID=1241878 RepID=A0A4D6YMD9_9GAMM|nr:TatD family hydrolase [Buchnera aphidicola]QCI26195.1 TatD family deoxyribonuclease [Buchnera aphidicola (Sarucallis kahawaluokalani)]
MYLIDSHCHLNIIKNQNKNIHHILKKAYQNSVKLILNIAISIDDYITSYQDFKYNKNILYSCGIHPLHTSLNDKNNISELEKLISSQKQIIALGETGLDFLKKENKKNIQIDKFQQHIYLSIKHKKPIIIHTRNAEYDTINILSNKNFLSCNGIIHSFTGSINLARKLLNLGFYISFSGIITFKNALYLKEIIQFIPINRILIETDSPYISPEPFRGKYNQPANLLYIAKHLAKIKNISLIEISRILKKNFFQLFDISKNHTN